MRNKTTKEGLVGMFAKNPATRPVKTRLAVALGPDLSRLVYLDLISSNIRELIRLKDHDVVISLDGGQEGFPSRNLTLMDQCEGDLGARMEHFFREGFASHSKVILIGSDCPFITAELLNEAFGLLDSCDVVLQPAEDGGYTLIGMNQLYPELFRDMPFSTDELYHRTRWVMRKSGIRYSDLPMVFDIDTLENLNSWLNTLSPQETHELKCHKKFRWAAD